MGHYEILLLIILIKLKIAKDRVVGYPEALDFFLLEFA